MYVLWVFSLVLLVVLGYSGLVATSHRADIARRTFALRIFRLSVLSLAMANGLGDVVIKLAETVPQLWLR